MVRALMPFEGRLMRPFTRFEEEMNNLMERFLGREEGWWPIAEGFTPSANIVETESGFEVTVELPGLKQEEVNVEVKNGALWITGEKHEEKEEEGKTFHRKERIYGSFRRVFTLPAPIKEEGIEAHFNNGVLTLTVPKTEEAKPKRIEVKA